MVVLTLGAINARVDSVERDTDEGESDKNDRDEEGK